MEHKTIPIVLLDGHKRNYRSHPQEQIAKLKASLGRFKQVRSIVVALEKTGRYTILAGHGVVQAAIECGITEINCDIVPESWSQDERNAYLIADNMHSKDAQDNDERLASLLQEQQDAGYDLASLGTDDEYLRQLLEGLGDEYLGEGGDEGEEDDFNEEPDEEQERVKLGDVWQLGRHTIACMNATDQKTYEKLLKNVDVNFVWSDPPYGIDIVATNVSVGGGEAYDIPFGGVKNRKKGLGTADGSKPFGSKAVRGSVGASNVVEVGKYAPIVGDDSTDTAIASSTLCLKHFPKALQIWWGANYYANALPPSSCWIVWDKENTGNFADAELAWCSDESAVRVFKHMWNGMLKDSEHGQKRVHPSQKPIKLAEWAFEKYGSEQDIIFDPFLGSGISVISAENMPGERKVIGCELSPDYINIILSRWEKLTGREATLLDRAEEAAHA